MAHMGPTLANSTNGTSRCWLILKNKKVFKIRKYYFRLNFFQVAIKYLCFQKFCNHERLFILQPWKIFLQSIRTHLWHFQRVNTKQYYTLSVFISDNTETFRETLPHKTFFVWVHIKQYQHFQRVATTQYYTHFWEFMSHNTFSGNYTL